MELSEQAKNLAAACDKLPPGRYMLDLSKFADGVWRVTLERNEVLRFLEFADDKKANVQIGQNSYTIY